MVGFVFDRRHDLHEPFHVVRGDAAGDGLFEIGEVPVHAPGGLEPLGRGRDDEGAAILDTDLACDEAAFGQAIENARQRRALVREAAVQIGDRRRRGRREQREDVGLALGQAVVTQIGQIEPDPVRRAVNRGNQTQ